MTLEAVFWDVGGVFSARPTDAISGAAAEAGVDADLLWSTVFGDYHADNDHPWHRLERGEIPMSEAWPVIGDAMKAAGIDLDLADVFRQFRNDPADRSVVTETLLELHATGVRMAIITNNVREFAEMDGGGWKSLVPMDAIDVVIDSSAVGLRKPDPRIYRMAAGQLGVDPSLGVFCDDLAANVDAAKGVGMTGIVVGADPAPAMAELRQLFT